jgi:hypothetical protein
VQEDVLGAVLGLNEAEALGAVKPLNGADRHETVPIKTENRRAISRSGSSSI